MSFANVSYEEAMRRAREIVPTLAERAQKCEDARVLLPENEKLLHQTGLFRYHQPKRFGGMELPYVAVVDIVAEVARGCPSTAWNVGNLGCHHWILGYYEPETQHEVWDANPDALIASSIALAAGRGRKTTDGYIVASAGHPLSGSALGAAEGALEHVLKVFAKRVGTYTGAKVSEFQAVQIKIARARALVDSARALMRESAIAFDRYAGEGAVPDLETKLRLRIQNTLAVMQSREAVETLWSCYGANAIYTRDPLQRFLRDLQAINQHFSFNFDIAGGAYGMLTLGGKYANPTM